MQLNTSGNSWIPKYEIYMLKRQQDFKKQINNKGI